MTGHRLGPLAVTVAATLLAAPPRGVLGQGGHEAPPRGADTIVLFNAGSLARPFKAALDTFATRTHAVGFQENAGSLETARKLTDLGRIPDVIALADYEVFPQLLMPNAARWYAAFARNRMVIAYTDRSKGAREIASQNWWQVLTRPGVEVGRADPNLDPAGYRTLLVYQLAEREYAHPGLAAALLAASPARNIRPKSADLVALLQTGELDYAWGYESVAQGANLRYVRLPERIDLSTPVDSAAYAQAMVRVVGKTPADTVELHGTPILYALSIPTTAPHPAAAERFVAFLFSVSGRRILRTNNLDVLDTPIVVGAGAPAAIMVP